VTGRTFKRLASAVLAIGFVVTASLAWYYLPFGPFLDDGPFHGVAAVPIDDRSPSQRIAIFDGFTLEVYDPSEVGVSPVVQLRDQTNAIRWTIHADGHESGDVQSIRFDNSNRGIARSGMVEGSVKWTYGHEYSVWFITGDGELRDYWYSW
jgi:hypothetical protein